MSMFGCLKKKKYATKAAAESVIYSLRARGQDTERLEAQPCDLCKGYHLGHKPRPPYEAAPLRRFD